MKLLVLLIQSFAVACFAQCNVNFLPKRPQGLVCGQRGFISNPQEVIFGNFTAPNEGYCKDTCFRDANCAAISYAKNTGECNLLSEEISKSKIGQSNFQKDKTSGSKFFNNACFTFGSQGCDVPMNQDFNGAVATGLPAAAYSPLSSEVQIAPWSIQHNIADNVSHAYLVTPETIPTGLQPNPDGGNFAVFLINGIYQPFLGQLFSLEKKTKYDISYDYSVFNFSSQSPDDSYVHYGTCFGDYGQVGGAEVRVYPSDANGEWHTYTSSLITPKGSTLYCGVQILSFAVDGDLASFAFSQFQIQPSS